MEALVRYQWPGNIRELQNVIVRAVIISTGPVLRAPVADLGPPAPAEAFVETSRDEPRKSTLGDAERAEILKALKESDWIVAGAHGAATRSWDEALDASVPHAKIAYPRHAQRINLDVAR